MMDTHKIGQEAEHQASVFLKNNGLTLLARNYRCIFGEIDLIMQDKKNIVFIEVRKRMHADFANPIESVTYAKQQKIIKTATYYLQKQRWLDKMQPRFDIIGISQNKFEWVQNAFSAEYI